MVAIMSGADNGFFYAGQVMHFSSPFTVFLIYHKHCLGFDEHPDINPSKSIIADIAEIILFITITPNN